MSARSLDPRRARKRKSHARGLLLLAIVLAASLSSVSAAPAVTPLVRPATREEGIERSIVANDIVVLARVLRVARIAPGDTTGHRDHLAHLATIEPVEWVKGALDYDDSLTVYLPDDAGRTAQALRGIARSRGDSAMLLFFDAGGYWRVDTTAPSPCGDHVGVIRVPAGHGQSELERMRAVADHVSLDGLARRAELVVVADCAPGPDATGRYARVTVTQCLKGVAPQQPILVAQCCAPIAGRQLLFLRRLSGLIYEPLPFAAPTRARNGGARRDQTAEEIEQVRESIRDSEVPE